MQIDTSLNTTPKASGSLWYLSLLLAGLVVLGGIGLFIYMTILSKNLTSTKDTLTKVNTEVTELSANRQVVITKIAQSNTIRPSLDVATLVNNFREVAQRSNVRLQGFSVKNDIISTTLTSTVGDEVHSDPAATIVKMMRDYATEQKTFWLEPILSISGDPTKRTTSVQFKIIPQIQK